MVLHSSSMISERDRSMILRSIYDVSLLIRKDKERFRMKYIDIIDRISTGKREKMRNPRLIIISKLVLLVEFKKSIVILSSPSAVSLSS